MIKDKINIFILLELTLLWLIIYLNEINKIIYIYVWIYIILKIILSLKIKEELYLIISSLSIVIFFIMSMISWYNQIIWLIYIYLLLMIINVISVWVIEWIDW